MFNPTTLYYFFSTLAQVIAALVALVAVLVHFRISVLRDFLVGDGDAIIYRKERIEAGYEILSNLMLQRLKDAVRRNDIIGIKNVIRELAGKESEAGYTLETRPNGFQRLLLNFENTESQINEMSNLSKLAFLFALSTAFISVITILFVDFVSNCDLYQIVIIGINLILLVICLYYIMRGVNLAFKNFLNRFE